MHRQDRAPQQSRKNDDQRNGHFEKGADNGRHFRRAHVFGGKDALHDEKIRGPVAHRLHRTQAEHDARPMDAHGIVRKGAHRGPHMRELLAGEVLMDACDHPVPAACLNHAEDGNEQRAEPDEEKLQNFVENCRKQSTRSNVNAHRERRHPNAEVDVPAEHNLHHYGHGVHIYAGHENGHDRERDRAEAACFRAVTQLQIARNRMRFRNVVKGHHDDAQKHHRRNGADPIPVRRKNPVLIRRPGPA